VKIIFLDESGYTWGNWASEKNLTEQPFHVLAAVSFPADNIPDLYDHIRSKIDAINVEGMRGKKLGNGIEIKARDIARGSGYWSHHEQQRNEVRSTFLESVLKFNGVAFLSIVDKKAHKERYSTPADPMLISLKYIYERLEWFLRESDDYGMCIHDLNKKTQDEIQGVLSGLNAAGSSIIDYDRMRIKHQSFVRILENAFGYSEASIGLQIADYFATQTNTFLKDGNPRGSGWWRTIWLSLKTYPTGNPRGYGFKKFP
jgi:hypothetical protein